MNGTLCIFPINESGDCTHGYIGLTPENSENNFKYIISYDNLQLPRGVVGRSEMIKIYDTYKQYKVWRNLAIVNGVAFPLLFGVSGGLGALVALRYSTYSPVLDDQGNTRAKNFNNFLVDDYGIDIAIFGGIGLASFGLVSLFWFIGAAATAGMQNLKLKKQKKRNIESLNKSVKALSFAKDIKIKFDIRFVN